MAPQRTARDARVSTKRSSVVLSLLHALDDDSTSEPNITKNILTNPTKSDYNVSDPKDDFQNLDLTWKTERQLSHNETRDTPRFVLISKCEVLKSSQEESDAPLLESRGPSKIIRAVRSMKQLGQRHEDASVFGVWTKRAAESKTSILKSPLVRHLASPPRSRQDLVRSMPATPSISPSTLRSSNCLPSSSDVTHSQTGIPKASRPAGSAARSPSFTASSWSTLTSSSEETESSDSRSASDDDNHSVISVIRLPVNTSDFPLPPRVTSSASLSAKAQPHRGHAATPSVTSCNLALDDIGLGVKLDKNTAAQSNSSSGVESGDVWARVIAKVFNQEQNGTQSEQVQSAHQTTPEHGLAVGTHSETTKIANTVREASYQAPPRTLTRDTCAQTPSSKAPRVFMRGGKSPARLRTKSIVSIEKAYYDLNKSPTGTVNSPTFSTSTSTGSSSATSPRLDESFQSLSTESSPSTPATTISSSSPALRWQDHVQTTPLDPSGRSQITYKSASVVYNQHNGQLGFEDQTRGDSAKAVFGIHPAFRGIVHQPRVTTRGSQKADINDVLQTWRDAGRGSPPPKLSAKNFGMAALDVKAETRADVFSAFSDDSSVWTVPAAQSKWKRSTNAPRNTWSKIQSPLSKTHDKDRPADTHSFAWLYGLTSAKMDAFRKSHSVPPLRPRTAATNEPVHPYHDFAWSTSRLCCRLGHQGHCDICGTTCCLSQKYETMMERDIAQLFPGGATALRAAAENIKICGGPGIEAFDTFVRCTECRKTVCPACAGKCPEVLCGDIVCKHCVPNARTQCANRG